MVTLPPADDTRFELIEQTLHQLAKKRAADMLSHFMEAETVIVRTGMLEMKFRVIQGDDLTKPGSTMTNIGLQLVSTGAPKLRRIRRG